MLETNEFETVMFAKGKKVESDIDLWHKQFGHVNFSWLREIQSKDIIFGLPNFSGRNGQVCEACQLGKQHRLPFPNERNRRWNRLDLIYLDVWGRTHNVSIEGSRYFVTFINYYNREEKKSLHLFLKGKACLNPLDQKNYFIVLRAFI